MGGLDLRLKIFSELTTIAELIAMGLDSKKSIKSLPVLATRQKKNTRAGVRDDNEWRLIGRCRKDESIMAGVRIAGPARVSVIREAVMADEWARKRVG